MDIESSKAGLAIGAQIILNKKGEFIGRVLTHRGSGGGVTVEVYQTAKAADRCVDALAAQGIKVQFDKYQRPIPYATVQRRVSGGYGYDKYTSALSGMWIDGHRLTDHCARDGAPKPPRGRRSYPADKKPPRGYRYANYASGPNPHSPYTDLPEGEAGYIDCYRESGLGYLESIGYRVIRAI